MPVLATCDLNEKCEKGDCQMFWLHVIHHTLMFPRLAVVILEIQDFKINKFSSNFFLVFTLKMCYNQNIHVLEVFSLKHVFLGRMFINHKQNLRRTYCVSFSKCII